MVKITRRGRRALPPAATGALPPPRPQKTARDFPRVHPPRIRRCIRRRAGVRGRPRRPRAPPRFACFRSSPPPAWRGGRPGGFRRGGGAGRGGPCPWPAYRWWNQAMPRPRGRAKNATRGGQRAGIGSEKRARSKRDSGPARAVRAAPARVRVGCGGGPRSLAPGVGGRRGAGPGCAFTGAGGGRYGGQAIRQTRPRRGQHGPEPWRVDRAGARRRGGGGRRRPMWAGGGRGPRAGPRRGKTGAPRAPQHCEAKQRHAGTAKLGRRRSASGGGYTSNLCNLALVKSSTVLFGWGLLYFARGGVGGQMAVWQVRRRL
jgi:hypothetical protein